MIHIHTNILLEAGRLPNRLRPKRASLPVYHGSKLITHPRNDILIREPAIYVDTKKKETLGKLKNPGKTYRRRGDPVRGKTHDFPDTELGKALPYGVYDIISNEAGVTVGIGSDTAEFAVAAIRRWWQRMGKRR